MRLIRTITASGTALGGAGYLLVRLAPAPAELARRLQAPHSWVAQVGTDSAVATLAGALLWLCALWVAVGLTAAWIGQLPGLAGELGRAATRCVVPVAIQRLVAVAAGFSLLVGGASAGAVEQPTGGAGIAGRTGIAGSTTATVGSATGTVAAPGWPLDQRAPTPSAERPSQPTDKSPQPIAKPGRPIDRPTEMPRRPAEQPSSSRPTTSQPAGSPTPDRSAPGPAGWPLDSSSSTRSGGPAPTSATPATTDPVRPGQPATPGKTAAPIRASSAQPTVPVRPGDSLWTIAGAGLGPAATDQQIAIAWPYWYRANRQLIGRDPNLLRPGTRLRRPVADRPDERPDGLPDSERQPIREGLRP